MLNRLLPVLIVNLLAVSGYAADVCKTLPERQQLKILSASLAAVDARIQALQPSPQVGDIARNTDGSIRYMNQADAINYCTSQGQHLPSARELAQLAQSLGAAGISETAKDGYHPVSAKNADGKADTFYFRYAGYNRPAGDLGNNWFWSSSVLSGYSAYAFGLYGDSGGVGVVDRDNRASSLHAVRCARGH